MKYFGAVMRYGGTMMGYSEAMTRFMRLCKEMYGEALYVI